ncbi:ectoine/hydroxyectoine ABC transporter permease subunit EhuD [Labrys wisconsinensis]|uniref:Polar amino acid transport system permease protein n=1 Tax=Labrys wisconsinensis TaxID=425677 RepID=A0ABU0JG52_9HYPH|nr:ectoine/hydroxyectoine ABC transporter permease subunit EhuD [Labrys wisconsinensis]MDQ0472112.1 polar amino acid transport system permease protein [Labrys wisconsinensis]
MASDLNVDTSSTLAFLLAVLPLLLKGLQVTVAAALLGFVVAAVAGLFFAVLRRSSSRLITWPLVAFLEFVRDTPLLIQLFFLYYVLPQYGIVLPAFVTGAVAIGLQYSAYTAEIYRAGIEAIAKGQWEASTALNMSRARIYGVVIIPQAIPRVVPALGNCLVGMLKETPILSTISVLEMLNLAVIIGDRTYQYTIPLTIAGILMLVVTSVFSYLIRLVELGLPKRGVPLR